MKYIILLGDGMADLPIDELGGKTPLQAANTPHMDTIAREGITGFAQTIPEGFPPGSDVANLSVLGYDPKKYYTGRAPLEAADINVTLKNDDVAFRCNMVTLKNRPDEKVMDDFSAGHIQTDEAAELIQLLNDTLKTEKIEFFPGVSYRHLMVWRGGMDKMTSTPPHDISGKEIAPFLPKGEGADFLLHLTKKSQEVLCTHRVNKRRIAEGKKPANSIWLWGQGKASRLPGFSKKYGIQGSVISAVNLMRGIGRLAGLYVVTVPGITGYIDTNYKGKVDYAIDALKKNDFLYLHVEAPDEASHTGNLKDKITALEDFDKKIVGEILKKIKQFSNYRILLLCDHPTPVSLMTHTNSPVPYAIYPAKTPDTVTAYDESIQTLGSLHFTKGYELMDFFLAP